MENQDITNIKLLITLGILITLFLAVVIILFVIYYQRKMLLKEAKIHLMEQEKQIALFKASVEAEEQQKEKIARNLHDEINPILTVLKFNLSKHKIEINKNTFNPESINTDTQLLDKAIEGIRTTCLDLIPTFLLQYGLVKSLESHVRDLNQVSVNSITFQSNISETELAKISTQDQLSIYRICLEILNNLTKHASYTQLTISITQIQNMLEIAFIHNGIGVNNDQMNTFTESSKGLGLKSLKARALILNAKINYQVYPNNSSVTLSIPIKHD